jgi:hypothetical protein
LKRGNQLSFNEAVNVDLPSQSNGLGRPGGWEQFSFPLIGPDRFPR